MEREREELQERLRQMGVAVERGRELQEEMGRKQRELERLGRLAGDLEGERANNNATIQKLKDRID